MEDLIFGSKPARYYILDSSDFDLVDNNDSIPSNSEIPDVENLKLKRRKNSDILN